MSESNKHKALVVELQNCAMKYVTAGNRFDCFLDTEGPTECLPPPKISGCIPDLLIINWSQKFSIIGEAKTESDLLTKRSRNQISSFIQSLNSESRNRMFFLAVPMISSAGARNLVKQLMLDSFDPQFRFFVYDTIVTWEFDHASQRWRF